MDATAQQLLARLRQNPTDGATISTLTAHCEQTGDYPTLVEALEQHARALAEVEGDPIDLGRIHFTLGNLFRTRLLRPDRAIVHYRAAIDFDAAQRPAMAAARAIYSELGKWDQVAKLLSREAESLPVGQKRATVLTELANVYRDKLGQMPEAIGALREAAAADPQDLQVRHDLATMLLDRADHDADSERADDERREAADVLCEMAGAVTDDYAFAYVEAALDAVPDHGTGLAMLEQVAPRVGRSDTIPPRWVAGLQMAPLGPLSRGLRLKLAAAYRDVGQVDDARASLEPLIQARDEEAQALASTLFTSRSAGRKPQQDALETRQVPAVQPPPADLAGPTGELALDDLDVVENSSVSNLADDLAALAARDEELDSRSSQRLDDLAVVKPSTPAAAPEPVDMLSSVETALVADDDAEVSDDGSDDADLHGEATKPRATTDADTLDLTSGETDLGRTPQVALDQAALLGEAAAPAPHEKRRELDATPVSQAPASDLIKLRADLEKKLRFRDLRGASEVAEAILAHDPTDPDAINALEDHYRASRDFRRMRELALRIAREPAMALDARISRLREAGMLSESKLGDVEGTIGAWRALLALSPLDEETNVKLRKLLTRQQRWDDLAQVLDKRALAISDPVERADVYRELALLHRDKRNNREDAIDALSSARDLSPDHAADDVMLSELLLGAERFAEAATAYEGRLAQASADSEKLPLLRVLAGIYEAKLSDDERAYEVNAQILRLLPGDSNVIDAMDRIDERQGRFDRLLETLVTRSDRAEGRARAGLLARAAEIARTKTFDLMRATDLYSEAFAFALGDEALITAAEAAFKEAGRDDMLTSKLAAQAAHASDKSTRMFLQRKVASRLAAASDLDGAITAYQALLAIEVEVETLRALVGLLERAEGRDAELAQYLDALATRVDAGEARDLRFGRAKLLAHSLADPEGAKHELRTILSAQNGRDMAALDLLTELASQTEDTACLAEAQEQKLALAAGDEARVELARSLAGLYEGPLASPAKAITALETWASLDVANPQPYLRLVPLLEQEKRFEALRMALDTLATLSIADDEASEFLLRAAKVAMNELGDHEGAWQRLVPRVVDAGDPAAEEALRELARIAGRGEQLAELFVGLAQRAEDDKAQTRRWMDAAYAYEMLVGSTEKALEAALRAFAKEMGNLALLDEVDRLAAIAGAWPRLAQVYDALARRGDTVEARARALMRHASLLEHKAKDVSQAFDRAALAFSLDPGADEIYAEASRLGQASERIEDLLAIHERRALDANETSQKISALIEACRLAQQVLEDAPRATGNLSRAVALAAGQVDALDSIEQVVKDLDEKQPPLDGRGLTRALCEVYTLRAEEGRKDPKLAAELLRRAAILLESDQQDLGAAYRALARAASMAPTDEALLDALVSLATRAHTLDALAAHFQQAADDAIDSNTASIALRRLSELYETALASPAKAAEVYRQLVTLKPRDLEIADKLRGSLKAAGQFKELLVAIDRQLSLVGSPDERKPLLQEAAETWETGLKNRFEARDAWKKVLSLYPDDAAAAEAVARLGARARLDETDLLEGDLVVRPEDLRPSAPPPAPFVEPPPPVEIRAAEPDATADASAEEPPHASAPVAGTHEASEPAMPGLFTGQTETALQDTDAAAQSEFDQDDALHTANADHGAEGTGSDTERPQLLDEPATVIPVAGDDEDVHGYESAGVTYPAPAPTGDEFDVTSGETSLVASTELSVAMAADEADAAAESVLTEVAATEDTTAEAPAVDTDPHNLAPAPSALLAELSSLDARHEEVDADDVVEQLDSGIEQLDSATQEIEEVSASASLDTLSGMLERGAIKTTPPTKSRIPPPPPSGHGVSSARPPTPTLDGLRPSVPPPPLPGRSSASPDSPRSVPPPPPSKSRG